MITFENVIKLRGQLIVDIPYLNLRQGRLTLIVGGNAEGKTTLLKLIAGGLIPDKGKISWNSKPLLSVLEEEGMCYVPTAIPFRDTIRIDRLEDMGRYLIPEWNDDEFDVALKQLKIFRSTSIIDLSKGQKQQLLFKFMLQKKSTVMVLDEPTNGLDTKHVETLKQDIQNYLLDERHMVVVATNQLEHLEGIADDVVLIKNGKVVLHEEIETLKLRYRGVKVSDKRIPEAAICGKIRSAYGETIIVDTDRYQCSEAVPLPLIEVLHALRGEL